VATVAPAAMVATGATVTTGGTGGMVAMVATAGTVGMVLKLPAILKQNGFFSGISPPLLFYSNLINTRVPGTRRPYYVHTPTTLVYESPYQTTPAIGSYSLSNGVFTYDASYMSTRGTGYRSLPVERPYSAAALARQGGRYPPTSRCVSNEMAYPASYYRSPEMYSSARLLMG